MKLSSVLLLGNYLPSLHAARALERAGFHVIAGDGGEYSPVRYSRSCHESWEHPPARRADELVSALVALLERRRDIGIVLPLRPDYVAFLAAEGHRLPAHVALATPDPEVVMTCLDKQRMYAIAGELGIPCEPTATAGSLDELTSRAAEVGYPCVIKPARDAHGNLPGNRKAIICADERALRDALPTWPADHPSLLVQRFAHGLRRNVAFAAQGGTILASVQTKVLRTDRLDGTGRGVAHVSVAPDPRLTRACEALAERLDYTGVGLAQFLRPNDGEPSFLELNPRHGLGLGFQQHLGLGLTIAACELARRRGERPSGRGWKPYSHFQPGDPFEYPVGERSAWTSRDLFGLGMALAAREVGWRGAGAWLARTLKAAMRTDYHQLWSARDPWPALVVYTDLAITFLGPRSPFRDRVARLGPSKRS